MRATLLNYRSPKERTAEIGFPTVKMTQVSHVGVKLNFLNPKNKANQRSTFSKDNRFLQYNIWEKTTGTLVGPGTYNDNVAKLRLLKRPCSAKMTRMTGINLDNAHSYIMVGDQRVYEPIFMTKIEKDDKIPYKVDNMLVDLHSGVAPDLSRSFTKQPNQFSNELESGSKKEELQRPSSSIYGCSSTKKHISYSKMNSVEKQVPFPESKYNTKYLSNEKDLSVKKTGQKLKEVNTSAYKIKPSGKLDSINAEIERILKTGIISKK